MKKVLIISLLASTINTFSMEIPTKEECGEIFNNIRGGEAIITTKEKTISFGPIRHIPETYNIYKIEKLVSKEEIDKFLSELTKCITAGHMNIGQNDSKNVLDFNDKDTLLSFFVSNTNAMPKRKKRIENYSRGIYTINGKRPIENYFAKFFYYMKKNCT